jgi:poly-gamma-glutamate synthesis protein (capsule biosynthesis protein)
MIDQPPSIKVAFAGDLACAGDFIARSRPRGTGSSYNFEPLNPELENLDLLVVNLEGPIGSEGTPRSKKAALLHNDLEVLTWFKQFPRVVCNLANNHMLDYGPEALKRTREILQANGIPCLGAGLNYEEANAELILKIKGMKLAFLSGTTNERHVGSTIAGEGKPGCAEFSNKEKFLNRVAELTASSDALIVNLHWGYEFFQFPHPEQVNFCRAVAQAGATLVINHHSHVRQGIEMLNQCLIAYSLGNLLLPPFTLANGRITYRKPLTRNFTVLKTDLVGGKVQKWSVIAGDWSKTYQLCPFAGHRRARFEHELSELSAPLKNADYQDFWIQYQQRRQRELVRESVIDSLAKIPQMNWKSVLQSVSFEDLKRTAGRFQSMLKLGHTPHPAAPTKP